MLSSPPENDTPSAPANWHRYLVSIAGLWVAPFLCLLLFISPLSISRLAIAAILGFALAPLPVLRLLSRERLRMSNEIARARDDAERARYQLETVRHRTARLHEELSAADRQARLSHQLTLLGQFTAGFMHEFNNPLAIVASRIEVLLEERKEDADLSRDLQQMLKETRYMGNIARTLLQALRRESGVEAFAPSSPAEAMEEALVALGPSAKSHFIGIELEVPDVPRVNLPEHVVSEVVRGLFSNAVDALKGRDGAVIWLRLEPYRTAGSRVVLRVEDNGPGVQESMRDHLFEPFMSGSKGKERLGLGLFLAANLLHAYDGRLRYEPREGGGSSFIVEMPPARFTRGQPYHWFLKGDGS